MPDPFGRTVHFGGIAPSWKRPGQAISSADRSLRGTGRAWPDRSPVATAAFFAGQSPQGGIPAGPIHRDIPGCNSHTGHRASIVVRTPAYTNRERTFRSR